MDAVAVATISGSAAVVAATIGGVGAWVARSGRRIAAGLDDMREDWFGTPARTGVPRRLGVMERLANIDGQLTTNGGSSLRDAVGRTEQGLNQVREGVSRVETTQQRMETMQQRVETEQALLRKRFDKHLEVAAVLRAGTGGTATV